MDRRLVLQRFARLRAAIRTKLPSSIEPWVTERWNRLQGGYRRRRADVVLVSYPKAGRTWLALMLGRALELHFDVAHTSATDLEGLHDADRRIPRFFSTHDGVLPGQRPADVRRDKRRYRNQRVLLLVRDPRDIVVSDYHHLRKRTGVLDASVDIDAFALGEPSGFATVLAFHQAWSDALDVPREILVVRYEDLVADAAAELTRILDFLGIGPIGATALHAAVEAGDFGAMQRAERADQFGVASLRTPDAADPAALKVRRGVVGGHRDELAPATCRELDEALRRVDMGKFGYGD